MLTIAVKNVKMFCKNFVVIPLLIGLPLFQLFVIKNVMGQNSPEAGEVTLVLLHQSNNGDMVQTFASSLLVMMIILAGVIAASMLIEEKEQNTMMRIFATPISKAQFMIGNMLGQLFNTLLVGYAVIIATSSLLGIYWGGSWVALTIVTVATSLVSISIGFAASALFNNSKLATGVMSFLFIVMTFASGGLTSGEPIQGLGKFTINKWANDAYLAIMNNQGLSSVTVNIAILVATGVLLTGIAIVLYGRESYNE